MTTLQNCYLAGLFDGEGCVAVYRSRDSMSLRVMMNNTDPRPIRLIAQRFGGHIRCDTARASRFGTKPMWSWNATGHGALVFLEAIAPFVVIKREQVGLALRFPMSSNRARSGLTNKQRSYRLQMALRLKVL